MVRLFQLFLPVLFPSWRFFEEIGPSPRIEIRTEGSDTWTELWPIPVRLSVAQYLQRLFYNPDWNRRLYLVSTAIRHVVDPEDHVLVELTNAVSERLPPEVDRFEFRIAFLARHDDQVGKFIEFESGLLHRSDQS